MESVRCYLCDHEFVEGEEPWLMFEKRLREDGHAECSLADLLGSILQESLEKSEAHSTLLCDSCNADLLEYESMEKRFSDLRERIMRSYKENLTIQNLSTMAQAYISNNLMEAQEDVTIKYELVQDNANDLNGIIETDLVEEVEEPEGSAIIQDKGLGHKPMDHSFDFAAFDEHVAQNSLPASVLNLSDGLVNLTDVENMPLEGQDIIIYDVTSNQLLQNELVVPQEIGSEGDMDEFKDANEEDLNFIMSSEGFDVEAISDPHGETSDSMDMIGQNNDESIYKENKQPKPVCKKDGSSFLCLLCEIPPVSSRSSLAEHMQTFHNSKLFMCEQCHEGFGRRQDFRTHTEMGHSLECNVCGTVFSSHRLFRVHKRMHESGNKPYECSVCQKKYGSKGLLDEHMNTHTGVRPYKCSECTKDFASKYTLQTHLKIHKERPRPYHCDQCGKQFLNIQNLTQHKKLHVSVKSFECNVCNKAFTTQHSLYVHQIVHSGQRPFICRICGKSFARRPEIKDHERTHTGEKPFKCDLCPAAFAQRSNLTSHKKSIHFNEKLHKCEQCLRSFKRKRLLEYHIQAAHTGERPHKCEICGAGFVYPEHFKKHMLIHSGKKPFACEVCGKQFNSRDNRNAHRFVHSDKKPYECMECGAGFMRKPLLLSHMKQTKHANDTIIVNQPQFTQQIVTDDEDGNIETNTLATDDAHNGLEVTETDVSLEKVIFKSGDLMSTTAIGTSVRNEVDGDVVQTMESQLIKDELGVVKYLQFEDLERDGQQTLTWVDIGGVSKL